MSSNPETVTNVERPDVKLLEILKISRGWVVEWLGFMENDQKQLQYIY
jgi:hypothetical protein